MSIDILKKQIKNKDIKNLYIFYGPEEYLKNLYLDSIEKIIVDKNMKTLNKIILEGKTDIDTIIDNCETLPVFSPKKVVVLKETGLLKTKGKDKNNLSYEKLISYMENIAEYTCLIFYEKEIDKRLKAVSMIKKKGLVVEFGFRKPSELTSWVIKSFKSFGKGIDTLTASKLVDNCELGMAGIRNEIEKIVLYIGDKTIVTSDDIDVVCFKSIKSRIFDLTDAIVAKNGEKAYNCLTDIIVLKEPLPKVLFMIARQIRQMLEVKVFINDGLTIGETGSRVGLSPYIAGK